MSKIGHFEILSELSKSATGAVYKANDPQTSQTVALKAIQLSAFGESAADLEKCLLAEAETTKVLSNPNLAPVYGAGEIEGQFYAAMEYIQGNSVALFKIMWGWDGTVRVLGFGVSSVGKFAAQMFLAGSRL